MPQTNERPRVTRPNMVATDKQIVDAIAAFWEKKGYAPSIREVCDAVGMKSPGTMKYRLERLRGKGMVTYIDRSPRTLRVVEP